MFLTHAAEAPRASRWTLQTDSERLALAASAFFALSANTAFMKAGLAGREWSDPATWGFGLALLMLLLAVHAFLLTLVLNRWTAKPLLTLLLPATALCTHFIQSYGVVLDPTMLRNAWRTDVAEARELLNPTLLAHLLLYGLLPLLLLWRVRLVQRPWPKALARRIAFLLAMLALAAASLWAVFQPMASWMRNHKEARYLVTPANVVYSGLAALRSQRPLRSQPREAIGLDVQRGASWAQRRKPLVVVVVVGETTRDANWGLSGYERQTTPLLAQWVQGAGAPGALPAVALGGVQACGTNTEVSLPCMFAPVGRRDHDDERIRRQESLLHVAARAGVAVHWLDNQSGCKGVCDGLPSQTVSAQSAPGLCTDGRCLDEALVKDLDERLAKAAAAASGTHLWVLHMLGSHGPAYHKRYPPAFARFVPDCRRDDLRQCSQQEIRNAYDNSVLYTDHVLATALHKLAAAQAQVDSALLFVSDHGESLGELGIYLHGMPYAMAPEVQKRVPLLAWMSTGFDAAVGFAPGCARAALRRRAGAATGNPPSHDHLFHTLLSWLDLRTGLYEPAWDLSTGCRNAGP
jgi:lipid A ethanolaminephosphotransferase